MLPQHGEARRRCRRSSYRGSRGEFDDRPGTGALHQHGIAVALMSTQQASRNSAARDNTVTVTWKKSGTGSISARRLSSLTPGLGAISDTSWQLRLPQEMPGEHLGITLFAAPDLAAKCGRVRQLRMSFDGAPM